MKKTELLHHKQWGENTLKTALQYFLYFFQKENKEEKNNERGHEQKLAP